MSDSKKDVESSTDASSDDVLADYYSSTHDTSEFDNFQFVPNEGGYSNRRSSVFSVRFSGAELDQIIESARSAGVKPGAFIRQAALAASGAEVDDDRDDDDKVLDLVAALRRSIEVARQHRREQSEHHRTTA